MAEMPEFGQTATGTLESIFADLRENPEVGVELQFPTIGAVVRLRVNPLAHEYFDLALFCVGDEEHEAHLADMRELQSDEEVADALLTLRQQDELQGMLAALFS